MMRVSWPARCRSPESCETPRLSPVKSLISATRAICDLQRNRSARHKAGHAKDTRTEPRMVPRASARSQCNSAPDCVRAAHPLWPGPHGACGAGRTSRDGSAGADGGGGAGAPAPRAGGVHLLPDHGELLCQRRFPPPPDARERRPPPVSADALRGARARRSQPGLRPLRAGVRHRPGGILLGRPRDPRRQHVPPPSGAGANHRIATRGLPRRRSLGAAPTTASPSAGTRSTARCSAQRSSCSSSSTSWARRRTGEWSRPVARWCGSC